MTQIFEKKGHGYQRGFDDSKDGSAICLIPSEILINIPRTSAAAIGPRGIASNFQGNMHKTCPGIISERSDVPGARVGEGPGQGAVRGEIQRLQGIFTSILAPQ